MNIIVSGTRTFNDYELLVKKLNHITKKLTKVILYVGDCKSGADKLALKWFISKWRQRPSKYNTYKKYPADWREHGKAAGPIRNSEMVREAGRSACLIAFHDGNSPGTADCIKKARKRGLRVRVIHF